jgi:hypothetical protein
MRQIAHVSLVQGRSLRQGAARRSASRGARLIALEERIESDESLLSQRAQGALLNSQTTLHLSKCPCPHQSSRATRVRVRAVVSTLLPESARAWEDILAGRHLHFIHAYQAYVGLLVSHHHFG